MYIDKERDRVFHSCWNKAAAFQNFHVYIILVLFSDYRCEINTIWIYLKEILLKYALDDGAEYHLREDILQI